MPSDTHHCELHCYSYPLAPPWVWLLCPAPLKWAMNVSTTAAVKPGRRSSKASRHRSTWSAEFHYLLIYFCLLSKNSNISVRHQVQEMGSKLQKATFLYKLLIARITVSLASNNWIQIDPDISGCSGHQGLGLAYTFFFFGCCGEETPTCQ